MSQDYLLHQLDARGVATLTLNRPERHNAFDDVLIHQLLEALNDLKENPSVRVLVLRATGKSFSAGADINWMQRMASYNYEQNHADAMQLAQLMKTLNSFPHPTLALVQGSAFGGGVGLIACCDMAIATINAKFSLSEVRLGLIPAVISPYVIRAIGERAARRYFLSAERFDIEQAAKIGLIHEMVTDTEALDDTAEQWIEQLLLGGPLAQSAAKKLIADIATHPLDMALLSETAHRISHLRASAEGREGLSAFLEKRPADWVQGNTHVQ